MRRLFSKNARLALTALPVAIGCALARQGDPPLPIVEGAGGEGTGGSALTGGSSSGKAGSSTGGTSGSTPTGGTSGSTPTGGTSGSTPTGGTSGSTPTGGTAGQGGTSGTATGGTAGSTGGSAGKGGTAGTATGGTAGSTGGSAGKGGTAGTATGGTAGGPPSGMELLRDNFEMGTSNWTMTPSGVWSTSMDGSTVLGSMGATGSSAMRSAAAGELSWTDVQIVARVKVTSFAGTSSGYYAGICARYQSASSYACFALRSNGQIMFRVGSNNTAAATPPGGNIQEGTWYNVRVVARGPNVTAFLNDTEIAAGSRVTSGAPTSGRIALACPGTNAVFDDIVVTTP
jgi:hypothetical protein